MRDQYKRGIRIFEQDGRLYASNSRFSRVQIQIEGQPPVVLDGLKPMQGAAEAMTPVEISADVAAVVTVIGEKEGKRGPQPMKTGPFEPDVASAFTLTA